MRCKLLSLLVLLAIPTAAGFGQTTEEEFKAIAWDKTHRGNALDLSKYKQTFRDDFDALSVTADGGKGPWFAPVHASVGNCRFLPPGPSGPFSVADGKMTIHAESKVKAEGRIAWLSSSMQTVDSKGQGFVQTHGYFEASMKMPPGPGSWPAFWLLSQNGFLDKTKTRTELDIVEWYGSDPKGVHMTPHLWPAAQPEANPLKKHVGHSCYFNVGSALTNGQLEGFHTYGAEVTPEWFITYFDRKETGRFKALPEFNTPLYMLVSLAMQPKTSNVEGTRDLMVDYVAAYAPVAGTP